MNGMVTVKKVESNKAKLLDEELQQLKTRIMLNKLLELNLSLYHAILNYAKRKGIPLTLDSRILQLTEEIEKTDIEIINRRKVTPFNQKDKTDGEVTEPSFIMLLYLVRRSWIIQQYTRCGNKI